MPGWFVHRAAMLAFDENTILPSPAWPQYHDFTSAENHVNRAGMVWVFDITADTQADSQYLIAV